MKKGNSYKLFSILGRLILVCVFGMALCLLLLYLLFKNTDMAELIFNSEVSTDFIFILVVMWTLGALIGALACFVAFVNSLAKKDDELKKLEQENKQLQEKLKQENKRLQEKLNKFSKGTASSSAERIFGEIGFVGSLKPTDNNQS